jgi:hypothetical protein
VGVELEFAAVTAEKAARRIAGLFGGTIERDDAHRYRVEDTKFGRFLVELDSQYAHRQPGDLPAQGTGFAAIMDGFRESMRSLYGDISSLVIPYEVVCPPVEVEDLRELEGLLIVLREEGAQGTSDHPLHAFGAQFNPDIATRDPHWILAILKAEILMSSWMRRIMSIDIARRLLAFVDPFPPAYARKILDPGYWPDTDGLIEDYLDYNPTRNRELDMLPLFTWLDEKRVRARLAPGLVRPRPTFHCRLPNANIREPMWSLTLEWNRWVVIERLADRPDLLAEMGPAYIKNTDSFLPDDWALKATEWLIV